MKLFPDQQGRVYSVDGPPPAGSPFIGGLAFNDVGQVYAANASPSDVYIGGWRVSVLGELVETDGIVGQRPYDYNAGTPQANGAGSPSRPGAIIRQVNNVPVASDPYVAGIRIGPLGGMYQVTGAPV